uniref:Avidin family protein n=1 Tax=Pithovirus LCPAC201 TaxID=2506591 RepID=A0A481Z7D4_9VIRU|nr:MAG: avidin family protein [Pithovirus LCPAC201]
MIFKIIVSLLILLLAVTDVKSGGHTLDGVWTNELKSTMKLTEDLDGTIHGTYHTASPPQVKGPFTLVGRRTTLGESVSALSFSVSWNNSISGNWNSATSWSGVVRDDEIETTWILTTVIENPGLRWGDTKVGFNVFKRNAP